MIEVIVFHVGDNGDMGAELQKRTVALVGLAHQIFALPQKGVCT